jgi:peroxiredoxin
MPTILVISNESAERDSAVLLAENVQPEHMVSDHHTAQLVERLGWAVTDAKQAEAEDSGRTRSG